MSYSISNYLKDFSTEEEVIDNLKTRLRESFSCKHAIPVVNGTTAIEVALKAMQIPHGSSVIVPDISFIATATAVANCGLIPIYCDIKQENFGISLETLKKAYNDSVKAVIVVHFAGFVNREIFEIKEFCESKGVFLLEDCAQVFPGMINGKRVGTIGDAGTVSFQSSKIVNSGEGGLIITNSDKIAAYCEAISDWGLSPAFEERNVCIPSSNYRMGAIQCYFVLKQLDILPELLKQRDDEVAKLSKLFTEKGISLFMPEASDNIIDCPFFVVIKSKKGLNRLEPRMEMPMRKSNIVKAIFKNMFPDLLEKYKELNSDNESKTFQSDILTQNNDFINLHNIRNESFEELVNMY
jgi:perosamine synthetase